MRLSDMARYLEAVKGCLLYQDNCDLHCERCSRYLPPHRTAEVIDEVTAILRSKGLRGRILRMMFEEE